MSDLQRCRKPLLPAGRHEVTLERIDLVPSSRFPGQQAREFVFSTADGEITRQTSVLLRRGGELHGFVQELMGQPIVDGTVVDFGELIGRRFAVDLTESRFKPRLIEKVTPLAG